MVDLQDLAQRARRANEIGRLRAATRIAAIVIPVIAISVAAGARAEVCACVGFALLAATIGLRWWGAEGARAVRSGLMLGAIPLAIGVVSVVAERWCQPWLPRGFCDAGCLLAGLFAGVGTAWYARRHGPGSRLKHWGEIGVVAGLTAALGCLSLGAGTLVAVLASLVVGAALGWLPLRRPSHPGAGR